MSIKLLISNMVLGLPLMLCAQKKPTIQEFTCPDARNSFRAISVIDQNSLWIASDQKQVWFFNTEQGWQDRSPTNYPDQDILWRDIHAYDDSTALILSAGAPGLILRTQNAGQSWKEVYRDDDPSIFFDAFDFKGAVAKAFSDAHGSYLRMIESKDSGQSWTPYLVNSEMLKVSQNQGGFAASGTCLRLMDENQSILVLGGPNALFKKISSDKPLSIILPLDAGEASKGAFSVDYKNEDSLIVVGGDYRADSLSARSVALSFDGGKSWQLASAWPELQHSYWSCVSWKRDVIVICSRFKSAISNDNGATWQIINQGFYSYEKGWFSGPKGRIGRLRSF